MTNPRIDLSPNQIVRFLDKEPSDVTRQDLVRFIRDTGVQMVDFRYPAGDMITHANPNCEVERLDQMNPQTIEFRFPDGSADIYGLLAGLTTAARSRTFNDKGASGKLRGHADDIRALVKSTPYVM